MPGFHLLQREEMTDNAQLNKKKTEHEHEQEAIRKRLTILHPML